MKIKWEQGNEAKLLEQKREEMNKAIGLNNISIKENITLLINGWCAEHIKILHKENPNKEWLAVCKVEPQGKWVFLMTDMVFPWQKTTSWDVETTKEWMEWLSEVLLERGENAKDWNCVLHSHHNMGCFWSGTDDKARLGLNDWRQLAWAVVTAYEWENIDYKWCINFYKPYNIEIDVEVKADDNVSIVEKYTEYLMRVKESEKKFYDFLLEKNKEYIDNLTERPSYQRLLEYLDIDISEELNENYETVKDRVWNPELLEYLRQLENEANELAVNEVNEWGICNDILIEYEAFCDWSDKLLEQLEKNKQQSITYWIQQTPVISSIATPSNRDFEYWYDDMYDYYITSYRFSEDYVRDMFWIDKGTPMRMWNFWEWLAWNNEFGQYMYVEEWAMA